MAQAHGCLKTIKPQGVMSMKKLTQSEMKAMQCGPGIAEPDGHIAELENYLAGGEGNPTGIQNRIKRCEEQKKRTL